MAENTAGNMKGKLLCPDCRKSMIKEGMKGDGLKCVNCGRVFETDNGIPVLLPKNISGFKRTEISFYEKEFEGKKKGKKGSFDFVEMYWDKNFFGLLDFMDVFGGLPKDSRILELGAGDGQYGLVLRKRGFRNAMISDISSSGLIAAKRYMEGSKGKMVSKGKMNNKVKDGKDNPFFVIDAENLPFQAGTFDVIFMVASLHHLQAPQRCIAEMRRCARKGGLIIIAMEPNSWYYHVVRPFSRLLKMRRIDKSKDSYSVGDEATHGFSLGKLEKYMADEGINVIKKQRVWYTTGITYYFPDLVERLFYRKISDEPKLKEYWITPFTLKLDWLIGRIPLIRNFSFHNTIIGRKA